MPHHERLRIAVAGLGSYLVPDPIAGVVRRSAAPRGLPLAYEFVRSVLEARAPAVDIEVAANWTAAGICAHESAMRGGERVEVPRFG